MALRTALVTGANRGIGLEACRELARAGYAVVLTARDVELGRRAAEALGREGCAVRFELLDVADDGSVDACADRLRKAGIHVDILVNNAGIYPHGDLPEIATETLIQGLQVNLLGALRTCRAFIPAMVRAKWGRVVNVSSQYGSFADGLEGAPAYSVSKAALNALTVKLAQALPRSVKVNSMCPGWVQTRMGGAGAERSTAEACDTLLWLATLPADGPTGGFFKDRKPIAW